jgi:hypothetical protein
VLTQRVDFVDQRFLFGALVTEAFTQLAGTDNEGVDVSAQLFTSLSLLRQRHTQTGREASLGARQPDANYERNG